MQVGEEQGTDLNEREGKEGKEGGDKGPKRRCPEALTLLLPLLA